jgi:hypothetical protein
LDYRGCAADFNGTVSTLDVPAVLKAWAAGWRR